MTALLVQDVIIALVVGACVWMAVRRLMPGVSHRSQVYVARRLNEASKPQWIQRVGGWLQPPEAKAGGCGSGNGCGSCGGCASTASATLPNGAQPLVFRRRNAPTPFAANAFTPDPRPHDHAKPRS